jgi:conjugal transfer/entry exclusion protein
VRSSLAAHISHSPSSRPPFPYAQKERESLRRQLVRAGRSEEEAEEEAADKLQRDMQEIDDRMQATYGVSSERIQEAQAAFSEDATCKSLLREVKVLIFGEEQ